MFPTIETERLILREFITEDVTAVYSIFSSERAMKYYGMDPFKNVTQAEKLIEAFASNFQNKRGMRWGIERKDEAGLIGTIGFNLWSSVHRRAEIGYDLHPDFWGNGYASEALKEIVAYGFKDMQLTRIGAVVYIENEASNQLLLKHGFEKEGILKKYMYQNAEAHDVTMFAKVK